MDINRFEAYRLPVFDHLRNRQGELHAHMVAMRDSSNLGAIHNVKGSVRRSVAPAEKQRTVPQKTGKMLINNTLL